MLVALRARHAGEAFEREAHVAGLGEDGFDSLLRLGIEVLGFFEQRGVAEDDGERVVELAGDIAGKLAEADELLGVDELLEHHGLAAGRTGCARQALRAEAGRRR